MPVVIVAGTEDQVSEVQQSAELHRDIAQSTLQCIPSTGHMVHQTATAEVMSAIDMVASQKKGASPPRPLQLSHGELILAAG